MSTNTPKFTEQQIKDWHAFERVRKSGRFNMLDPRARALTSLSREDWLFCIEYYEELETEAAVRSVS